ncbi:MAG TPA: hypothetical protein VMY40_14840, partial [Anaerolineae bacterium]|nr:hypothetical protein [Anaerolineae bacterium]
MRVRVDAGADPEVAGQVGHVDDVRPGERTGTVDVMVALDDGRVYWVKQALLAPAQLPPPPGTAAERTVPMPWAEPPAKRSRSRMQQLGLPLPGTQVPFEFRPPPGLSRKPVFQAPAPEPKPKRQRSTKPEGNWSAWEERGDRWVRRYARNGNPQATATVRQRSGMGPYRPYFWTLDLWDGSSFDYSTNELGDAAAAKREVDATIRKPSVARMLDQELTRIQAEDFE